MNPVQPLNLNLDILPEGITVIGSGRVKSSAQLTDLIAAHKRDGYTKLIVNDSCPVEKYWELAMVAKVVEGTSTLALKKGAALMLYVGTEGSFKTWLRELEEKVERVARGKESRMVN